MGMDLHWTIAALAASCLVAAHAATDCSGIPNGGNGLDVIYIVRHGEKNKAGNHLSSVGLARAQLIKELWGGGPGARFAEPKAVFANFYNQEYNSVELARPLAQQLGLPVISGYNRHNNTGAAAVITEKLDETEGPIFVAWEHKNIVNLVHDLGCSCPWMDNWAGRMWPKTDFDEIFILGFRGGSCIGVDLQQEGFNATGPWKGFLLPLAGWTLVVAFAVLLVVLRWKGAAGPDLAAVDSSRESSRAGSIDQPFLKSEVAV